ncbi:GTP-binding protein [Saxibacter everestensis]|uniref:GTP-binding protein n=1 Tax=Saxibacter everestensis TaxID=2909229 RepID=A0ABY8QSL2_9MICO|nr:GTP-binding protein [Brevibacteriaceae bacterium ZFBP1038]
MNALPKIPVTALTGFLGSGKTTLVNHILTAEHGRRIAVIENEFGEIDIDSDLVVSGDEKIIEMSNGCCLCCTARTDLIEILHDLLGRRERFDHILIETSGLADPNPVAQTFFVDDSVAENFGLDAIVTLVDAAHIEEHLDETGEHGVGAQAQDQIAFADRIVINKIDLVDEAKLGSVTRRVRSINASADILTSTYADIDLERILGIGAFDLTRTVTEDPSWLEEEHNHDPSLSSVGISLNGSLDRSSFESWLNTFIDARGGDVYRLKGLLAMHNDHRRIVVQGVHRMFELTPTSPWGQAERTSKLVIIGRELDRSEITEGLEGCLSS